MQSLDFCVNRLLMKLFCTNNSSTVDKCRHYFNIALPSELLRKCIEKFLRKLNAHLENLPPSNREISVKKSLSVVEKLHFVWWDILF